MSSQLSGTEVDLGAVNAPSGSDAGVAHGARLLAFTDAVMGSDETAIERERASLLEVLTAAQFVDVAATIAAFNVVDRIADSTGIPLDSMMAVMSVDVRRELDLARFASAANTPGAR